MKEVVLNHNTNVAVLKYRLIPPDGGWGYMVAVAVTLITIIINVPLLSFGLIFGKFLANLGDETMGTAMANGLFNTISSFMGLIVGAMLSIYSARTVGIIGALFTAMGSLGLVFSYNLLTFLISFSVLQGIGFGILTPATFTSFESYFYKRLNFVISVSQAVVVMSFMITPPIVNLLKDHFGYRYTLVAMTALTLLNVPLLWFLQPVQKHMKRVPTDVELNNVANLKKKNDNEKATSLGEDVMRSQIQPLINEITKGDNNLIKPKNQCFGNNLKPDFAISLKSLNALDVKYPKPRKSILSVGNRTTSVSIVYEENKSPWKSLANAFDFSLLRKVKYINLCSGMSLTFASDLTFLSLIPMMLKNVGFNMYQQTVMMSFFFGSDLISRILLAICSYYFKFSSRYLFFWGATLSIIFRLLFVAADGYYWRLSNLCALGFLRCFVNTTVPLTISEQYPTQFANAFSLYMAVCGATSLGVAPLVSFVKEITQSDVIVCHLLTFMLLIFSVTWAVEFLCFSDKRSNLLTTEFTFKPSTC